MLSLKSVYKTLTPFALVISFIYPTTAFATYYEPQQFTNGGFQGVGGYIYSTTNTINDPNNDHVLYYVAITDNTTNPVNEWTQIGRAIGSIDGYTKSSPFIYTETQNSNYYGSSVDFHQYGTPGQTNEGYWTYYDGYYYYDGSNFNYEYDYDYGSYGNHAAYTGYLSIAEGYAWAVEEVMKDSTTVSSEPANAYFGTNNGTASSTYQLILETSQGTWGQWNSSVSTQTYNSGSYYWTELNNYWAAHSH